MKMRINGLRAGIAAAAFVTAAAGAIVAAVLLPGSAQGGAPLQPLAHTPTPVPSITLPSGVPTTVPPTATPPPLTLEVATSGRYGPILVTLAGLTVYRPIGNVTHHQVGFSPVLVVKGAQLRLPILVTGKLGTVPLSGGQLQLTFNGAPLYSYSGDHVQGDTNGVGPHWRVIQTGS
jgi:hypothetical protein